MKKNSKKDKKYDDLYKNIDNYIDFAKADLLIYTFFCGLIIIIILYFSINFHPLLFSLIFALDPIDLKVRAYYNTKKITDYIYDNNLRDKIGNVDYWNEKNYIFCENFIFYCKSSYWKRKVFAIKYEDIKEMNVIRTNPAGWTEEYLVIKTKDDKKYKILIFSAIVNWYKQKDVSQYILNKNPNIKYNPKSKHIFWMLGKD